MGFTNRSLPWRELGGPALGPPTSHPRGSEGCPHQSTTTLRTSGGGPRRAGGTGPPSSPTPSCTATPTSASSTAPRTPRSWPRRPPASGSRRSPSPTTTASTAWSASPRRPARSGCPRCSAPSSPSRPDARRRPATADPDGQPPRGAGPRTRRATPAWPGPSAAAQLAGEKGAPRIDARPSWPTLARRRTGWCSPVAARARCPPRSSTHGPAAAAARAATG